MNNFRFVFLVLLFLFNSELALAQLILSGKIQPSSAGKWESKLYVLRVDRIGLSRPILVDSVKLKKDGSFSYTFNDDPQGILYKIMQPIKGKGLNSTISGFEDHWFYISTEEKGNIQVKGDADSLYYSLVIVEGEINKKLQFFRDIKKPLERIAREAYDSMEAKPLRKEFYKEKFLSLALSEMEVSKRKLTTTLDTAKNTSIILAGLLYLNEASLGNLTGEQISKYSTRLFNDEILLVRNTKRAINEIERNRIGIVLSNVTLRNNRDEWNELNSFKSKLKVLDFWASWCGPCRYANKNQLPELNSFLKEKGIPLIGITIDTDEKKWKEAVKKDKTTWQQFIDPTYSLSKTLDIQGIPSYLVLGENNEVIFEGGSSILVKQFIKSKMLE